MPYAVRFKSSARRESGIVKPQRSIDELFIFKLKNLISGYNIDIGREAWD
jgi:hypothetical protein